jgi:hypothetical protein
MGARRVRTIEGICLLGLVVLALRPFPALERALDTVLVTSRWLPELSIPLERVQAAAAVSASPLTREREGRAREALEAALQDASAPPFDLRQREDFELNEIEWVHAEVLSRSQRSLDTLLVRVADPDLIKLNQPVVSGDVFVGKVTRAPNVAAPGDAGSIAEVTLVTSRSFRVGAQVQQRRDRYSGWEDTQDSMLVVGGIVEAPDGAGILLGAHNPQDRALVEGRVVVSETSEALPGSSIESLHLANGFSLGTLKPEKAELDTRRLRLAGIKPSLDYASGLYQLTVLVPSATEPRAPKDPIAALPWRTARLLLRGDTSATREGRKLARGFDTGVEPGAALADGVRLVGRVHRAGIGWSDLALLGDAGLTLPGLAALGAEEDPTPFALGELVSLGRDVDGNLRMRWSAVQLLLDPSTGELATTATSATIWSGSGSPGLPRGLLLGTTTLPPGIGPHELILVPPPGVNELRDLTVVSGGSAE